MTAPDWQYDAMTHPHLQEDTGWAEVLSMVTASVDLEASARAYGAFRRARGVRSASDLLRLALCHAAGLPFRQTVAWAAGIGAAQLSAPSLHQRLGNCGPWLDHIVRGLVGDPELWRQGCWSGRRLRIIDATSLSRPGDVKTTWRVQVDYNAAGHLEDVAVMDCHVGERFRHFTDSPGDLCIADRGYAKGADIFAVINSGADVVVRTGWKSLHLRDGAGQPFDLFAFLGTLGADPASRIVSVKSKGSTPSFKLRLIACRLPPDQVAKAQKKIARSCQKHCKKGDPRSLLAAGFIMLLTSLGPEHTEHNILALYRLRWQVELFFKRLKSLMGFDALRLMTEKTSRTWIFAKLILAILAEKTARHLADSFPSEASVPGKPSVDDSRYRLSTSDPIHIGLQDTQSTPCRDIFTRHTATTKTPI